MYLCLRTFSGLFSLALLVAWSLFFCLPDAEAKKIRVGVKPGLQFDPKVLPPSLEQIELTFDNADEIYNLVLVQPGSLMGMVEAAIALAEGPGLHYAPKSTRFLLDPSRPPGKRRSFVAGPPQRRSVSPRLHARAWLSDAWDSFVSKEVPKEMILAEKEPKEEGSAWGKFSNQGGAIVHRTFMPDSSPAAIAVNLPGGHSYCWDAGVCRLRYAWRGGFIKKNGSFGRWRTLPTIEGLVYLMEDRFPFREMGSDSVQVQFDGYRMIDGIPEFRYRVGDLKVREYLAKLPGKSGLIRRFKIDGSANGIVWEIDPDSGVSYSFDKASSRILPATDQGGVS